MRYLQNTKRLQNVILGMDDYIQHTQHRTREFLAFNGKIGDTKVLTDCG